MQDLCPSLAQIRANFVPMAPRAHRGWRNPVDERARQPRWARDLLLDLVALPTWQIRQAIRSLRWLIQQLEEALTQRAAADVLAAEAAAAYG